MKYLISITYLIVLVFGLYGCDMNNYSLITKQGIVFKHIHSKSDCEKLIKFLKIKAICIKE